MKTFIYIKKKFGNYKNSPVLNFFYHMSFIFNKNFNTCDLSSVKSENLGYKVSSAFHQDDQMHFS